jgi:hypothetical protein
MAQSEFVDWFIQQLFSEQEKIRKAVLGILPQGHGGGFNADLLDDLHAEALIEKASTRAYLLLTRKAPDSLSGGGGTGPHTHPISEIVLNADLLPEADGAYAVGDDNKGWTRSVYHYLNDASGMDASVRVGSKLPSDDPYSPGEAVPHLDLVPLPGLGVADEFRVCTDTDDFMFTIKRRVLGSGSWADIMRFNGNASPTQWLFGASFLPTTTNAYDFGAESYRFRDMYFYRYLDIFGFVTLPTPTLALRAKVTFSRPITGSDFLAFCRRRYAGDYKWKNLGDSFESIAILKSVNGITVTDIGQTAIELLGLAHRSRVDLTYMDRCRVVFGGVNSEAAIFYCKIQYSTDGSTWYDLTPEGASDGTVNEQLVIGAWGNVPTGALSDVYIRAVGRAADDFSGPTYKAIELQVR